MRNTLWCVVVFVMGVFEVQAQETITGKVINRNNQGLDKVTVHILNTLATTYTDSTGGFIINKVPAGNYAIEFILPGYAGLVKQVEVKTGGNESLLVELPTSLVQLETVVVTADKKEALLQRTPVSVTALSATAVNEYRLWNARDLTGIVPNLYAGNSGDERNVTSIRGITTTSYDPAVATYVDGVNQFNLDTYIPQLTDVDRIEVLRGPQGTLYGRNATGGVINIVTKKPTNTPGGFAEVNLGNFDQQRYSAGVRFPLIKDKLFVGASGLFNKRRGYYQNEFNNKSFDDQQQVTGNYYLRYLPAAQWAITLNVKHQNNQSDGAFPMVNGVEEAFANPYVLNQNALGKMMDNTLNTSLSINHSGASVDFSSQTAWQKNYRYYKAPVDGDFSPLDAVTIINDYGKDWNNVKVLTQEFRLSSAAGKSSPLTWTAGTYFFHQNSPVKQATHFGKDAGLLGVPATDFATINTSKSKNTGLAFFGQLKYAITEKLDIIAGLRYDYENKKLSVKGEYQPDGQAAFETRPDTSAAATFNAFSPKLGLQFELTPSSNVYAMYSRGFRTGGLSQLSSDPSQPPLYPYQPEYSNNFEIGIKNNFFNNKLHINLAAFITYLDNAQVPTLVVPDAITIIKNTGKLTSKGAELELSSTPFKGLQLGYNFGYVNAGYESLKIASNGQVVNLDGKKQIFTPDVTSMLTLQYSYELSKRQQVKLVARGEWFYFGRRYFDFSNTIRQAPYSLLNTRVGISAKNLGLYFWMRNLTDRKYMEYAYDFGAVHLGVPKTYGITLSANF